ncbi:MAG: VCBS repeat-containing protein, partial [Lentisphaerae bacterium]|nr:VCBS repeat-containing protein [Lentisphaerota bacterium]
DFQFGWPEAVPVAGDFNGDGETDGAVFDRDNGLWYITGDEEVLAWELQFGMPGALVVPGDYDGDGITDLAVFDTNTGSWYITDLSGEILAWDFQWGWPGARPVGSF